LLLFVAALAFATVCLILVSAKTAADARISKARSLCDALRQAETQHNGLEQWVSWMHAVGQAYLTYDQERVQTRDPPLDCGSRHDCDSGDTGDASGSLDSNPTLSTLYKTHAAALAPPSGRVLRVPLGLGIEAQIGLARARVQTCLIPPRNDACAERERRSRAALVKLRTMLHRALARAIRARPPPVLHARATDADAAAAELVAHADAAAAGRRVLESVGRLARRHGVRLQLQAADWRRLDALSAIVWKRTLAASAGAAGDPDGVGGGVTADALLHGDGRLQYVGHVRAGRFHGDGVLFYPPPPSPDAGAGAQARGRPAYSGGWRSGRMDGAGALFDREAREPVWVGTFSAGRPVSPAGY
jgi:hypothetical protein